MQSLSTVVLAGLLAVAATAAQAAGLEVKTCPDQALHAYPLAPGTRFQSLVVPDLAVANRGAEPAELTSLTFELLDKGVVVDTRRLALPEAFAYDIVRIGADDRSYRGQGTKFTDYYAYGAQVMAVGDGVVAEVVDDQPEDPNVLRRPGETFDAYGDRAGAIQMVLL